MGSIKDSGHRRTFETGAVRDMAVGKGRCDLLPMEVVSNLPGASDVVRSINSFLKHKSTVYLYQALDSFCDENYEWNYETMLLEVAKHFEEGNNKYPPSEDGIPNWKKGIPTWCYIDSALRHYLKHRRGDRDEHHDRAFVWNIMCCIWEVDYHD